MTVSPRDLLARQALAEIPKILTLLDRTPFSRTYGCFDRIYWHYRMIDFPCGMSQEFVYPLALAWCLNVPNNPYYQAPAIRDFVEAGIRFAARSAHSDGSCDDYYPFERAAGAAAFSLLACLEAASLIGLQNDPEIRAFFRKRAGWLATHKEAGRLSNHEALIVANLIRMSALDGDIWEAPLRARAARLLSWQDEEGWFDEYGGADPGYLSLTIGLLADSDRRRPDLGLRSACQMAIQFFAHFVHPDGTVGGSYTSRGTQNFFPHGFEIAGEWMPEALLVNDRALALFAGNGPPCYSDDHIIGHHVWSWLLCWSEWRTERECPAETHSSGASTYFPRAGLAIEHRADRSLYTGLRQGGAFQLFSGGRLTLADSGVSIQTSANRMAVQHLPGDYSVTRDADGFSVTGQMAWAKATLLTPVKSVILRCMMITLGRFFPDMVRRLLQKILVTGRREAPFRFHRTLRWSDGCLTIRDEIFADEGWEKVVRIGIGGFQTSSTTIMARVWQANHLQPWQDMSHLLAGLSASDPLIIERQLPPGQTA
ncbi:hypothetical protein [Rhizorhapis suberifaciens]|uniref:Uncharacterized protein n=1 Tax=Rhizorhapis suberifaciens TaxID=13656 RepID=A0A840HRT6_9SPHN|nr:hypothetical protein [Rhizorhapis suberifaciens]MBB4640613.1 hypothetical protein [Rhizorhapis suberifaciens]